MFSIWAFEFLMSSLFKMDETLLLPRKHLQLYPYQCLFVRVPALFTVSSVIITTLKNAPKKDTFSPFHFWHVASITRGNKSIWFIWSIWCLHNMHMCRCLWAPIEQPKPISLWGRERASVDFTRPCLWVITLNPAFPQILHQIRLKIYILGPKIGHGDNSHRA